MSITELRFKLTSEGDDSGFNKIDRAAGRTTGTVKELDQAISNVGKGASLPESFQSLLSSANKARETLTRMATESGVEGLRSNLQQASALLENIKVNSNLGISLGLGKGYDLSQFRELDAFQSKMSGVVREIDKGTESMRAFGSATKSVGNSSKGFLGNLASSFMRIAKLRLLRGILRSFTQGVAEGTKNLYAYSQALNSADSAHFAQTMDNLTSSLLTLKNQIGAAIGQALDGIAPILMKIVGWVTAAIDALSQFFAVLQGKSTYTRAKQVSVQWQDTADNIGSANANAKELQRTLLGFDEINALDKPSEGSGGGSGGGGSSVSPSDMFEEAAVATTGLQGAINKLAEWIHPVIEAFSGIPEGVDAALTVAASLFENSPEKFREGMNKFQNLFKNNETLRSISEWAAGAAYDISTFFSNAWLALKKGAMQAAKEILIAFKPILELLGVDVDACVDALDIAIQKLDQDIKRNTANTKLAKKAYAEWASGKMSTAGWTVVSNAIAGCFGKGKKVVNAFYSTVKLMEKHGYNPDALTNGVDKAKTKADKAQIVFANLRQTLQKMSNDPNISTKELQQAYKDLTAKAEETTKAIGKGKDALWTFGNSGCDFTKQKTGLEGIGSSAKDAAKQVNGAKDSITNLNKQQVSTNGKTSNLDSIGSSADNAKKNVGGIADNIKTLNGTKVNEKNNVSQFKALGDNAYYAKGGVVDVNTAIKNLKKQKIDTSQLVGALENLRRKGYDTAQWITQVRDTLLDIANNKSVASAFQLIGLVNKAVIPATSKKNGGYVGNYASGGIIPRFDGGGIHTADIFIANENANPELVGRIGNRTAVANQGQMVEAMAQGVYEAMMEVMSANNGANEVNVYIDGERVARAVDRANRLANRRFNVGVV